MTWISTLIILLSLLLIVLKVEPVWIQYLAFALAVSFFIFTLLKDLPQPKVIKKWVYKVGFLSALVPLILLSNFLARKYEKVWDASLQKPYTFGSESIQWLSKVKEPVQLLIFLRRDDKSYSYVQLLKNQLKKNHSLIDVEVKNITTDLALAQKYQIDQTGQAVLIAGGQWIKIGGYQEKFLIPGIIRLLSKQEAILCFAKDHGEPDITYEAEQGLSKLNMELVNLGYKTRTVSFLTDNMEEIKTCHILFFLSPKSSFLKEEIRLLDDLSSSPIRFFFALDPPTSKGLGDFLKNQGINLSDELVINLENKERHFPLTELFINSYGGHPILHELGDAVYMPYSQALGLHPESPLNWTFFLATDAGDSFRLLGKEKETSQVFNLAGAAMDGGQKPKMVVFGTGRSFNNANFSTALNRKMFLNAIRWLLVEKEISWSETRETKERFMNLTSGEETLIKNFLSYVFPGLVFVIGFLIWLKHRKL